MSLIKFLRRNEIKPIEEEKPVRKEVKKSTVKKNTTKKATVKKTTAKKSTTNKKRK